MKYFIYCLLLLASYQGMAQMASKSNYYNLDRSHSELNFSIRWMGAGKTSGTFDNVIGTIYYDPKKPADLSASLKVNIKTLSTGNQLRDNTLMKDWFDTANHSFAYFESLPITREDKPGKMRGNFTLKGITKVITLDVSPVQPPALDYQNDPFIVVTGRTLISRKEFNITQAGSRYETSQNNTVAISDSVMIEFNLLGKQISQANTLARITQPGSRSAQLYEVVKTASPSNIKEKLDSFYKTPAANPRQDFSAWYVGTYYLAANDLEKAIPILLESYRQFPDAPISHETMMQLYVAANNMAEAKKWMNSLLAIDPRHPNGLEYKRRL